MWRFLASNDSQALRVRVAHYLCSVKASGVGKPMFNFNPSGYEPIFSVNQWRPRESADKEQD
ncbi:MAG: hypothetical protein SPK72_06195 [Bacteroidales bacterium]|nr:hypothetical protein [Bacteroidales bacterium]